MGIAASHGLTVQLTLFDWLHENEYADIAGSEQWAHDLLAPYTGDPRIAFVEVRNELDPNDPQAVAWARDLIPYVRDTLLDAVPVTISVAGPDPAASVRTLKAALAGAEPDFYTIHYYGGDGDQAYWTLLAAQQAVAPVCRSGSVRRATQPRPGLGLLRGALERAGAGGGAGALPADGGLRGAAARNAATGRVDAQRLRRRHDPHGRRRPEGAGVRLRSLPYGRKREAGGCRRAQHLRRPASAGVQRGLRARRDRRGRQPCSGRLVCGRKPERFAAEARDSPHGGTGDAIVRSLDGTAAHGMFWIAPIASTPPPAALQADASVWVRGSTPGAGARIELEWLGDGGAELSTGTRTGRTTPRLGRAARRRSATRGTHALGPDTSLRGRRPGQRLARRRRLRLALERRFG